MSLEERTREEVARRLDRLADEYGEFPVREETVTNAPDFFERGAALAEEGWIGDAGAWVTDDADRVLLIRHEDAPGRWGTPGGGHEPGETMVETARREVREETGVECAVTGVRWARRKTIVHEEEPERRLYMLTVAFAARARNGEELEISDDDVLEARWFAERPDSVHESIRPAVEDHFEE